MSAARHPRRSRTPVLSGHRVSADRWTSAALLAHPCPRPSTLRSGPFRFQNTRLAELAFRRGIEAQWKTEARTRTNWTPVATTASPTLLLILMFLRTASTVTPHSTPDAYNCVRCASEPLNLARLQASIFGLGSGQRVDSDHPEVLRQLYVRFPDLFGAGRVRPALYAIDERNGSNA